MPFPPVPNMVMDIIITRDTVGVRIARICLQRNERQADYGLVQQELNQELSRYIRAAELDQSMLLRSDMRTQSQLIMETMVTDTRTQEILSNTI
jgi:hypothetical protein